MIGAGLPLWAEALVALLVVAGGLLALLAAVGLVRLPSFFQRMHPTALAYTLATWCIALATVVYLSVAEERLSLSTLLIPLMLAITVPVTTVLLARAALFRQRQNAVADAAGTPPPLK